ncbi:hypothetical protein [Streptomyces poonensis]|uniref:Resolvase/invertase-type recombinase catalytic domain-containing protein n=1 Tax=Streptomyces poonensis TaxID=68255 RepID=A0A918URF0_9ACTN|nr:hypothetical protein [Streptomyces poonensis]GGZ28872.1 hypothetical protein GCM10010365_56320 [Streptomyces poonensis]
MANLVYKRVSTDQQSTDRQNLVLDEGRKLLHLRGDLAQEPLDLLVVQVGRVVQVVRRRLIGPQHGRDTTGLRPPAGRPS